MRPVRSPIEDEVLARAQRLGSWGGATDQVGRQWERLARPRIEALIGQWVPLTGRSYYQPLVVFDIDATEEIRKVARQRRLKNSDLVLVGRNKGGQLIVQPVDFKWSLRWAERYQVSGEAMNELFRLPQGTLCLALSEALGQEVLPEETSAMAFADGFFVAPETAINVAFLNGPVNLGRRKPLRLIDVRLEKTTVPEFFEPLPGFQLAAVVARLDSNEARAARDLTLAEYYYHLAMASAAFARDPSQAEQPAEETGQVPPERLEALYAARDLATSGAVLDWLGTEFLRRFPSAPGAGRLRPK